MRVDAFRPPRAAPSPPDPFLGNILGGCRIDEVIGRGGMGVVYKAMQLSLNRPVAIKVLPEEVCGQPQFVERFKREVDVLSRLSHPNVVTVFERGEIDGRLYVIMEYVQGTSLREVMRKGPLPAAEALVIVRGVLSALEHAHGKGIIHRDIKPENVLVATGGIVKVADFGLSRLLDPGAATRLTHTNLLLGTFEYMAPEQREKAKEADERADIYATGVVLYEMLAGELPIGHFDALSRKRPKECDSRIDEIVERSLAKAPDDRYQRASEMGAAVSRILSVPALPAAPPQAVPAAPPPAPARRRSRFVPLVFLAGVLVLAFSGWRVHSAFITGAIVFTIVWAITAFWRRGERPRTRFAAGGCLVAVFLVAGLGAAALLLAGKGGGAGDPSWFGDPKVIAIETRDGKLFGNLPVGSVTGRMPPQLERSFLDAGRVAWIQSAMFVPFAVGPVTVKLRVVEGKVVASIRAREAEDFDTTKLRQFGAVLAHALAAAYPGSFVREPSLPEVNVASAGPPPGPAGDR